MKKIKKVLQKEYTEYQDKRIPLDQPRIYKGPVKVGMLITGQDNSRFRVVAIKGNVVRLKPTSNPGEVVTFPDDFKEVSGFDNFWDYFILEKILENIHMKRSELVKVVREVMQGHSPQVGKTNGGTAEDFKKILTTIAKQGEAEDVPKEEISEDADKLRAEHLGTLRGSLMHIETMLNADRPHAEILAYVQKAIKQVSSSDPLAEGESEQTYLVHFRVGEEDEDDVKVKASSPEEAIDKVRSGKVTLAYGQPLPRLARGFSAKLLSA